MMIHKRHYHIPASYLMLIKEQRILLLRRFNTGYEDGNYSLIAGHAEAGETFTQCIIREAKEEVAIILQPKDVSVAHVMHRNTGDINNERVDVFFVATKWQGDITNTEPHKCDDLSWFDMDNLPSNTIPYITHAIHCVHNQIQYSEYGW